MKKTPANPNLHSSDCSAFNARASRVLAFLDIPLIRFLNQAD
jgi:hypothetical protein